MQSAHALPAAGDEGVSALPHEEAAGFEEETPAMDPAFAKLSDADRQMFADSGDETSSHFLGDMNSKEKDFAALQGNQQAMFGLSDEVSAPCRFAIPGAILLAWHHLIGSTLRLRTRSMRWISPGWLWTMRRRSTSPRPT